MTGRTVCPRDAQENITLARVCVSTYLCKRAVTVYDARRAIIGCLPELLLREGFFFFFFFFFCWYKGLRNFNGANFFYKLSIVGDKLYNNNSIAL